VDNGGKVRNLVLPGEGALSATFVKDLLGGCVTVRGEALAVSRGKDQRLTTERVPFQAVPYCLWDNRAPGPMVVWLPERQELAELPHEDGVLSGGIRVSGSHVWTTDTLTALNDGALPKSSGDHGIPRMTWWDRKGSTEWVAYHFPQPRTLSASAVYWFDDTGRGGCRVPAEWRLLWLDGEAWKPVKLTPESPYATEKDRLNRVEFEPVRTQALKLEVKLQPRFSGGVLEWTIADGR
jgi:hypothetical protein